MVMEITWPPTYLMQINKEKLDFVNFGDILSNLKKNQPNKNITKTKKNPVNILKLVQIIKKINTTTW